MSAILSTQAERAEAAPTSEPDDRPVTVIEARPGWQFVNFRELWRYRELLYFLMWRDVKVRYKQTALGVGWALLQPLATMMAFSLFLGRVAGIDTGDVPYPLFVLAGVLPWMMFAGAVASGGQSVVGNQSLVTKVYFPRLIIPTSAVGVAVFDFLIATGLLAVMMGWYGVAPGWHAVLLPGVVLGMIVTCLGAATLLSALTVAYRDFRYVVPFGVQLWMFATPCIYLPSEALGETSRTLLPLNPAYGLIHNFRLAALGGELDVYSLGMSLAVGSALLVVGCAYFRRVERSFADVI